MGNQRSERSSFRSQRISHSSRNDYGREGNSSRASQSSHSSRRIVDAGHQTDTAQFIDSSLRGSGPQMWNPQGSGHHQIVRNSGNY